MLFADLPVKMNTNQLNLLLWKNYIIRKRQPVSYNKNVSFQFQIGDIESTLKDSSIKSIIYDIIGALAVAFHDRKASLNLNEKEIVLFDTSARTMCFFS